MAIISLLLFSYTLLITYFSTNSTNLVSAESPTDFIQKSCKTTNYPDMCLKSLATYAKTVRGSHRQLAHAALTVSANRAHEASTYLSGLTSKGKSPRSGGGTSSFQDCNMAMADSANRLKKSAEELRRLVKAGSRRFALRIGNIETWVSAALTDQNTCLGSLSADGGGGGIGGTGAAIRKKVTETSQVTTNALSFVNGIGSRN